MEWILPKVQNIRPNQGPKKADDVEWPSENSWFMLRNRVQWQNLQDHWISRIIQIAQVIAAFRARGLGVMTSP